MKKNTEKKNAEEIRRIRSRNVARTGTVMDFKRLLLTIDNIFTI